MGLLKLAENVPGIDFYEYRDQHYYNKYEYRARFNLFGVRYTWYIKDDIQELIDRLDTKNNYSIRLEEDRDLIRENLPKLDAFIQWRTGQKNKKNSTIRIEGNTVAVFSNDLVELKHIETAINGIEVDYTQAQMSNYIGVKHFVRRPKHNFRIYLKSRRVEGSFAEDLHNMFKNNKKLYPSPALRHWALGCKNNQNGWRYRFSNANHFIDYDDESTLSYLALMHGDMLGKRYKLEKRPEEV
jgi:hypothetical protein